MNASVAAACPEAEAALARSAVYRLLALAFTYPDASGAEALRRLAAGVPRAAGWPDDVRAALEGLAAAAGGDTESARAEHVATFGHVTLPDCPLYESACGEGDPFRQPQTLADLAGFYRAFGLEAGAGERADHLAVELEFMHYLAYREAYALERHGPEQVETIREAQRRFLAEHLGRWAPVVARAVVGRAPGRLAAAARALRTFLAHETSRGGREP